MGRTSLARLLPPRRSRGGRRARRRGPVRRRSPPTASSPSPPAGHRRGPRRDPHARRRRLVGVGPLGRRGGHRRHAVPRRLGDDGAQPARPQRARRSSTRSFDVERDITGELQHVHAHEPRGGDPSRRQADDQRAPDARSRGCTSRSTGTDDDEAAEITEGLQRVLRDVRESVEDWEKMHAQALAVVDELDERPAAAVEPTSWRRAATFLTLARRRPLHVPRLPRVPARGGGGRPRGVRRCAPSPAPASASCATTRTCRRRSPSCPRW